MADNSVSTNSYDSSEPMAKRRRLSGLASQSYGSFIEFNCKKSSIEQDDEYLVNYELGLQKRGEELRVYYSFPHLVRLLVQSRLALSFPRLNDVVDLIRKSKRIIVLTGAGVSVSCGIPDFRSRDGIYARLSKDFPDLPDPQAMFDIHYFKRDPRPFFKFAKEIYPGQFKPSPSHHFIRLLEKHGKLMRNYTQNIDTLEKTAGIEKVITCHGSFATATCTRCKNKVDARQIQGDVFAQNIPYCPICVPGADSLPDDEMAVMKPDIVFFGEDLSAEFHQSMAIDRTNCDLLIVMGSSLRVRPVALIPSLIDSSVPQILINREPLSHLNFDVELLGDCDRIVQEICNRLGESWTEICETPESLIQLKEISQTLDESYLRKCQVHEDASLEYPNSTGLDSCGSTQNSPSSSITTENSNLSNKHFICGHDESSESRPEADTSSSSWPSGQQSRTNLADSLPTGTYFFVPPNRYVFQGAEVYESNGRLYGATEDSCHEDDSEVDDSEDDNEEEVEEETSS